MWLGIVHNFYMQNKKCEIWECFRFLKNKLVCVDVLPAYMYAWCLQNPEGTWYTPAYLNESEHELSKTSLH